MKQQSKAKLLKVLKTLQGYQRRALGTEITLEVGVKKFDSGTIGILVWVLYRQEIYNLSIYDFYSDDKISELLGEVNKYIEQTNIKDDENNQTNNTISNTASADTDSQRE